MAGERKDYANAFAFLADPENAVEEETKQLFLKCTAEVQKKVMARGDLSTAKNKTTALNGRIRDARYVVAIENGETPPADVKIHKKDKNRVFERLKREEEGGGQRKRARIDIDLAHAGANAKTELASFLQAKCGRAMSKTDIIYKTESISPGLWLTTVECPCLDGEAAVGEPDADQRNAEKSAAKALLEKYRAEIEEMNKDARPIVVRNEAEVLLNHQVKKPREDGDNRDRNRKGKGKASGKGGCGRMWSEADVMLAVNMVLEQKGAGKGKGNVGWGWQQQGGWQQQQQGGWW